MEKLLLIDGNSIMNRAFYGTQASFMKNSEGLFTGALYGFLNIMLKYTEEEKPQYMAVAFDLKAPTFRHKMYDAYKGTRHGMPDELAVQMPVIKEILDAMNIARVEIEGYEADDIIGTYARLAEEKGIETVIVTGDKDSLQLITDKTVVKLPVTSKGVTKTENMDEKAFAEKYGGLKPKKLIDLKALMGDSSDNIPGVPGVGEKTAVLLLQQYGSLDGVYEHADEITKPALKAKITENRDSAYLSYTLATIFTETPVDGDFSGLKVEEYDEQALYALLSRLEFKSIIKKLNLSGASISAEDELAEAQIHNAVKINTETVSIMFPFETSLLADSISSGKFCSENMYIDVCKSPDSKLPDGIRIMGDTGDTRQLFEVSFTMADTEIAVADILKPLFSNKDIKINSFDSKAVLLWIMSRGMQSGNVFCDLSVAGYLIDSTRANKTYSDACKLFCGVDSDEYGYMPSAVSNAMSRLEKDNLITLFNEIELPLVEILASFEYEGFCIDADVLKKEGESYSASIASLAEKIYEIAGHEFNINSPLQLGEVLFEELKLPGGKKNKKGYKTDQDVLESVAEYSPIGDLILRYRQNVKLQSTYIDGLLAVMDEKNGKVHSSFNQTVTATGRLSSTEPNLQNIPVRHELGKKIRYAFVPSSENHILVDADYSQIELRVLAAMSGDEAMTKAFRENADIHALTAAQVNGVDISEVTPEMRSAAKAVNFGIVYGISEFGLAKDIGCSRKEAKRYIDGYFKRYPGVKLFMDEIVAKAKETGYAESLFGRRRYLPELSSPKYMIRSFGERVAMNMPIQGTAADIIKIAMVRVYSEIKKRGLSAKMILQVHDELLIDTPIEEKEEVEALLRDCMEKACTLPVPLSVSVSCGKNWAECK